MLAAFYLELTTGLRRGELLALQWTDLDVESKTLSITKQVNRINGELVVSPPKTRNSVRTLALPQQAVDLLIAEHKKHSRNPYLFPSPKTGTMYDPDAFRRTHDKILKAIGAEHIRFHDLRHPYVKHTTKIFSLRLMDFQAQAYTNYIENHIVPGIGNVSLDKLTTIQIQRFYNTLQKSGRVQRKNFPELKDKSLSPRVVRGVHTLLHNCLEQAVAERLILANPAQGCKLPQLEKKEMKILPQEKIGLYLAEAEKRGLLAAFYLELTTGLRRGELLALQWTDLDIENRTLAVTKQVNRINGELVVSPPKTRNSVRTLALPQQAVDLLIAEHKKHPRNPYLFPSPKTGTMYDPDAFRRTHDKILKAIGAEHIRFHDLRHTFATLSLKSGVDVKTLSGALGHYSAGFTLNTYTHATAQMKQDAADTIGGVISQQMR